MKKNVFCVALAVTLTAAMGTAAAADDQNKATVNVGVKRRMNASRMT